MFDITARPFLSSSFFLSSTLIAGVLLYPSELHFVYCYKLKVTSGNCNTAFEIILRIKYHAVAFRETFNYQLYSRREQESEREGDLYRTSYSFDKSRPNWTGHVFRAG